MTCPLHFDRPSRFCDTCLDFTLPAYDPECSFCGGDGYVDYYTDHLDQSVGQLCRCEKREGLIDRPGDSDGDGWWDGIPVTQARFYGGRLERFKVTRIVIHCGHTAAETFGRYFASPRDRNPDTGKLRWRRVSAHGAVLDSGKIEQYVPYTHKAWHAGAANNSISVGLEHRGPSERYDWPDKMAEGSLRLVKLFMSHYPNIREIYAHSALAPKRRTDPGPHFPFHVFDELGLKIVK